MSAAGEAVSVIIPALNAGTFIGAALESIEAQTVRPGEVIVVDGGSSDRTPEIAQRAGARAIALAAGKAGAGRGAGIECARGDLLAFLDADDLWRPTKLERQLAALAARPDVGFAGCLTALFLDDPSEPPRWWNPDWSAGKAEPSLLPSAIVVRRSAFTTAGTYQDGYWPLEDVEWTARAQDCGITRLVVEEVLVDRRIHSESGSIDHAADARRHLKILRESIQRKRANDDG
jgi:glycosyltransferase involved in cell wall biosynthesis